MLRKYVFLLFIAISLLFINSCKEKSKTLNSDETIYSCTMHHQVREEKPGPCPICGMEMVIVPDIEKW